MSLRKPRSDARLRNLPEELRDELVRRLVVEGERYADVRDWLAKEHAVKTSVGALSEFWNSDCVRVKFLRAKGTADTVKGDLAAAGGDFGEAAVNALSQRVFELAIAPGVDAEEVATLVRAITAHRRVENQSASLELANRRIRLLEEKAEADRKVLERAAAEAKSGGLTAATLEEMERRAKIL